MSERDAGLSGGYADEPPKKAAELPLEFGASDSASDEDGRFSRIATLVIAGFWLLQWIYFSVDNYFRDATGPRCRNRATEGEGIE